MSTPLLFYYHNISSPLFEVLSRSLSHWQHQLTNSYDEFRIDVYALLDQPRSNVVALDWDNTITADVGFYSNLINTYIQYGAEPIICSLREHTSENIKEMQGLLQRDDIAIYCTDGVSKQDYLDTLNVPVNLWLDDFYPAICRYGCPLLTENGIYHDQY